MLPQVRHHHAPAEGAAALHPGRDGPHRHHAGIHRRQHGQGIVDRAVVQAVVLQPVEPEVEGQSLLQIIHDGPVLRRGVFVQDRHMVRGQPHFLGHIQPHHGQVKARLEHPVRRLRVPGDVGLRHRGDIPRRTEGAAHEHHFFQKPGQLRLPLQRFCQIRHPGQGHQGQLTGVLPGHPGDEVPGRLLQRLLGRGRQLHAADAVGPVDVGIRSLPVPRQRLRGPHGHRHLIGHTGQPDQPQGVLRRLSGGGVPEAGGDAHHPDIRPLQRKQNGDGIVDAGIGVDQDLLQHLPLSPLSSSLRCPGRRCGRPGR